MKENTSLNDITFFNRITFQEKLLFTKHLAVMIKSGITVSEALDILAEQTKSSAFKKILSNVLADVNNGQALAEALEKHNKVFDQFYVNLVKIGEESGTLEENLNFLSLQLGKDYNLRKKIQGALLYPGLILAATTIMGGFISLFVLPQLVDFFDAFDTSPPLATRILLSFAELMKNYGILIVSVIGVAIFSLSILIQTKAIKPMWHKLILRLPLFGGLIKYGELARFARNLGVLLKSGVPISSALETTGKTLNNLTYQNALVRSKDSVKKGKQLAEGLESNHGDVFPRIVSKMIAVGEKTGNLEESLLYLGDFYEEEIDNFSKNLTTILEPVLLLIIGLVVGFVAIAIISPIYDLTGSIRR